MPFRGWKPLTISKFKTCSFRSVPLKSPSLIRPPKRDHRIRGKALRCPSSLTAECALVLPLFLMAVLTMLSVIDLLGDLGAEDLSLSNRARELAVYAGAAGGSGPEWIDLTAQVRPKISFSVFPSGGIRAQARARVRVWKGFDASDFSPGETASDAEQTVYVTDYESVCHTHADCTHLDLTVIRTDTKTVGSLRNVYGERYKKCDGFPSGYTGTVYVTAKGDRYYPSSDYAGLNRHVRITTAGEAGGLPVCSRCAERDHAS